MKKSIYYRNLVTMAGVVLVSFLLLGSVFSAFSYRVFIEEKRDSMSRTAGEVARSVSSMTTEWAIDSFEVRLVISMASNTSGYQIMLADTSGMIISCSDRELMCEHYWRVVPQDVVNVLSQGEVYGKNTTLGGIYGETKYVIGKALTQKDGRIYAFMFLSGDSRTMAEVWRQSAGTFLFVAVIVLCLTLVLSLITSKKQAEPINEIAEAADRFARGEFSVRVTEDGRIDEIGQLAHAFNKMADALESSERRRREFIANVSHELKTPMTTISGFSDGILDGTIPPEKQAQYLGVISSETRRLSRLVRSMLDMSQLQAMDASKIAQSSFDISEVVRVALLGLEHKITERGLDVDAELPEDPIITRGDRDSITQVVYNLIDNATKFADKGSTLKIALWKRGGRAYVSVEDTGPEIPADELPLIFDRFHKTDRSRSSDRDGVGLGLYIVKTILDNHNEDIYVTSTGGVTKFEFTLTIAPDNNTLR